MKTKKFMPGIVLKPVLCVILLIVSASGANAAGSLKVMTKNMDAGTDFGFFLANLASNPGLGVQLTLDEVAKNNFSQRGFLLAQEIAAARPDVVGLQEATLWQTPQGSIDQLQILLGALASLGEPYHLVQSNTLTDILFAPGVGFTDRDAIIARDGSSVGVGNVQLGTFSNLLSFAGPAGPIVVKRGWISANLSAGTKTITFVTTHLESSGSLYGSPLVNLLQAAQATELAATFAASSFPVVIGGDLNSNATHTPPEQTPSFKVVTGYGYADTWSAVHRGIPGFTWPLYSEDPLRDHPEGPLERIDFIFARGIAASSVERTGVKAPHSSDHAGVLAVFGF
jgi:endonuclease/exonuclease/phosphatase family metal-dependent hydrolase